MQGCFTCKTQLKTGLMICYITIVPKVHRYSVSQDLDSTQASANMSKIDVCMGGGGGGHPCACLADVRIHIDNIMKRIQI